MTSKLFAPLVLSSCLALTAEAFAAPVAYTSSAAFFDQLANLGLTSSLVDFESTAAGTLVASGDTIGGVTFSYDFQGVQLAVTDGDRFGGGGPFAAASGANFLGTDDADLLQSGDDLSLAFGAVHAIGLYVFSIDTLDTSGSCSDDGFILCNDDIGLSAGGATAWLDLAQTEGVLSDGANLFFLGVIDADATFASADLTSTCCGYFTFNVDALNLATAASPVPAPAPLALLCSGLLALSGGYRKSARADAQSHRSH